jgi:hypothetical protein
LASNTDRRAFSRESVPDVVRRLVEGLNQPAYVTGPPLGCAGVELRR